MVSELFLLVLAESLRNELSLESGGRVGPALFKVLRVVGFSHWVGHPVNAYG